MSTFKIVILLLLLAVAGLLGFAIFYLAKLLGRLNNNNFQPAESQDGISVSSEVSVGAKSEIDMNKNESELEVKDLEEMKVES